MSREPTCKLFWTSFTRHSALSKISCILWAYTLPFLGTSLSLMHLCCIVRLHNSQAFAVATTPHALPQVKWEPQPQLYQ